MIDKTEQKKSPIGLYLMRIDLLMHLKRFGEATDECEKILGEDPDHELAKEKYRECFRELNSTNNK